MQEIKISIIVPVYKHWTIVTTLIDSLAEQTLNSNLWELIIIDNGSDDIPNKKELKEFVNLYYCSKAGSYAARNVGLLHAKGELLVFTDADCNPKPDWLEVLLKSHNYGSKRDLIAGAIQVYKRSFNEQPNSVELYDITLGLPQENYVKRGYAVTANLAIPKVVFEQTGIFDESRFSGGDSDICRRAVQLGFSIRYEPEAVVQHPARSTWFDVETKVRRVKGGQIRAGKIFRRAQYLIRTFLPPMRAYMKVFNNKNLSFRGKLIVSRVLLRLWFVEIDEVLRLLLGKKPERR